MTMAQRRVEKLKGRLYTTSANRPCPTLVAYHWDPQQPEKGRYVITDGQLQGSRLQPYVHDTRVRVRWNGTVYTFLVLYKRHRYLPVNGSTPDISNAGFRGDALVVAEGPLVGARGMGGRETRAADYTMKRCAATKSPALES